MALIDVTELFGDPDFIDSFTLVRRTQTVDTNGRTSQANVNVSAVGSVQPVSAKTLELFPDLARATGQIEVWTTTPIYALGAGRAADEITWAGASYTVVAVRDWRNWGGGWNVAIATMKPLQEVVA